MMQQGSGATRPRHPQLSNILPERGERPTAPGPVRLLPQSTQRRGGRTRTGIASPGAPAPRRCSAPARGLASMPPPRGCIDPRRCAAPTARGSAAATDGSCSAPPCLDPTARAAGAEPSRAAPPDPPAEGSAVPPRRPPSSSFFFFFFLI